MTDRDTQLKLLAAVWNMPHDSHYLRAVPDSYFSDEKLLALKHKLLDGETLTTREVMLLKNVTIEAPVKVYANTLIEEGFVNEAREYGESVTTLSNRRRVGELQQMLLNPPAKPSLDPPMNVHERTDVEIREGVKFVYEYPPELRRVQQKLGRLYPGSINVIAADNGGGKSLYMEQLALGLAKQAEGVCDFSVEMPFIHRLFRYIQHTSGSHVGLERYFEGDLSAEDIKTLSQQLPKNLVVQNPVNITDVLSVAEQLYRQRGVTVFMLDFLQALQPLKGQQKYESIAHNIEAIYHFTLRFPTVWFIGSQYNREGKKQQREDRHGNRALPANSDLLGANEIETYAWTISHIITDDLTSNQRRLYIGKNRFGTKGEVPMTFNETLLTFEAK